MNKQHKQLQCEDNIMINNISICLVAHPLSQPTKDLPIEPLKKKQKSKKTHQPKFRFFNNNAI
jgi:hypothetical protein